jgi:hypothetical protein
MDELETSELGMSELEMSELGIAGNVLFVFRVSGVF